jgi:hypothetical protein
LTNVTIAGNSAAFGGAITYNNSGSGMTITNSIIWGNSSGINSSGIGSPTISSSWVQGVDTNDPLYVTPVLATAAPNSEGNYQLQTESPPSPVIHLGDDNSYLTARGIGNFTGEKDLAGADRKVGSAIDMGAYEVQ